MKRHISIVLLFLCLPVTCHAVERTQVFVSILPIKYLAERIGGQHIQVTSLLRHGQSPETFEPTVRQVGEIKKADVFLFSGIGFENAWIQQIKKINPGLLVVDLMEAVRVSTIFDKASEHLKDDPHLWTNPVFAKLMVQRIRDALIAKDAENQTAYQNNANKLEVALNQLDQELKTRLKVLLQKTFIVFHPAWGHFSKAYGLTQIGLEKHGKEPGAKHITEVIALARKENIRVIFKEPLTRDRVIQKLALSLNARIDVMDPLAEDYIENLRRIAAVLEKAANEH